MAKDPVCGMIIDSEIAEFYAVLKGNSYYFCSKACKVKFEKNPSICIKRKGVFARFLENLTRSNKEKFGNTPPSGCSGH